MKKHKWNIVLINLVIVLLFFNASLIKKEKILDNGKLVLLELRPVDPRSLMQGDYMDLRYAIGDLTMDNNNANNYCVIQLTHNGVGELIRLQPHIEPHTDGDIVIKCKASGGGIYFGAESFFFQEGTGEKYETAKYGGLRIDKNGKSVLVGLYDRNWQYLE